MPPPLITPPAMRRALFNDHGDRTSGLHQHDQQQQHVLGAGMVGSIIGMPILIDMPTAATIIAMAPIIVAASIVAGCTNGRIFARR